MLAASVGLGGWSTAALAEKKARQSAAVTAAATDAWVERDGRRLDLGDRHNIFDGDLIATGPNGGVQLIFTDGTVASLAENTRLGLCRYSFQSKKIPQLRAFLQTGAARFAAGQITDYNLNGLIVETPQALVSPHGGSFAVSDFGRRTVVTATEINQQNPLSAISLAGGAWQSLTAPGNAVGFTVEGKKIKPVTSYLSDKEIAKIAAKAQNRPESRGVCGSHLSSLPQSGQEGRPGAPSAPSPPGQGQSQNPPIDAGQIALPPISSAPAAVPPVAGGPAAVPPIGGCAVLLPPVDGGPIGVSPINPAPIQVLPTYNAHYSGKLLYNNKNAGKFSFDVQLKGSNGWLNNAEFQLTSQIPGKVYGTQGNGQIINRAYHIDNFKVSLSGNVTGDQIIMNGGLTKDRSGTGGIWQVKDGGLPQYHGNFGGQKQ